MNSGVGKNYPFCDFETTSARDVSYLDSGEEEWRPPVETLTRPKKFTDYRLILKLIYNLAVLQ